MMDLYLCLDKGYDYLICHDTVKAHDYIPHIRTRQGRYRCTT